MANSDLIAFFQSENWKEGMDLNAVMHEFEKNGWSKEDVLTSYELAKKSNTERPLLVSNASYTDANNINTTVRRPLSGRTFFSPIQITLFTTLVLAALISSGAILHHSGSDDTQVESIAHETTDSNAKNTQEVDNSVVSKNVDSGKTTDSSDTSDSANEVRVDAQIVNKDNPSTPEVEITKKEVIEETPINTVSKQTPCAEFSLHLTDCSPYQCSFQTIINKTWTKEVKGLRYNDATNSSYCETVEDIISNYALVCRHHDDTFRKEMIRYYEQTSQGTDMKMSIKASLSDTSSSGSFDMGEVINNAIEKGVCEVILKRSYELNAPEVRIAEMVKEFSLREAAILREAKLNAIPPFDEAVGMLGDSLCENVQQSEKQSCQQSVDCLLNTVRRLREYATKEELHALSIGIVQNTLQPSPSANGFFDILSEFSKVYAPWGQAMHDAKSTCREEA